MWRLIAYNHAERLLGCGDIIQHLTGKAGGCLCAMLLIDVLHILFIIEGNAVAVRRRRIETIVHLVALKAFKAAADFIWNGFGSSAAQMPLAHKACLPALGTQHACQCGNASRQGHIVDLQAIMTCEKACHQTAAIGAAKRIVAVSIGKQHALICKSVQMGRLIKRIHPPQSKFVLLVGKNDQQIHRTVPFRMQKRQER